jgi:hypothetical protein
MFYWITESEEYQKDVIDNSMINWASSQSNKYNNLC